MKQSDTFNGAAEKYIAANKREFTKDNDVQLCVQQPGAYYAGAYRYNFLTRMVLCDAGISDKKSGITFVPFSQTDRDVLEAMHAKLKKLGGDPPPLPEVSGKRELIIKGP